jgi:hypothetical protein
VGAGHLQDINDYLGSVVQKLILEYENYQNVVPANFSLYGPFVGRALLEVGSNLLLSRIDPFRVLSLRQVQLSSGFLLGKRNECAIAWMGDIMPDDKETKELWAQGTKAKDISRSLLGSYSDHVCWRPAFQSLIDALGGYAK